VVCKLIYCCYVLLMQFCLEFWFCHFICNSNIYF